MLNLQMRRTRSVQWKVKNIRKTGRKEKIIGKERRGMKWKGEGKENGGEDVSRILRLARPTTIVVTGTRHFTISFAPFS